MEQLINQVVLLHEYNRSLENQLESYKKELLVYLRHSDIFNTCDYAMQELQNMKNTNELINSEMKVKTKDMQKLLKIQQKYQALKGNLQAEIQHNQELKEMNQKNQSTIDELARKITTNEIQPCQDASHLVKAIQKRLTEKDNQLNLKDHQSSKLREENRQLRQQIALSESKPQKNSFDLEDKMKVLVAKMQQKERQLAFTYSQLQQRNQEYKNLEFELFKSKRQNQQSLFFLQAEQQKGEKYRGILHQRQVEIFDKSEQIKKLTKKLQEQQEQHETQVQVKNKSIKKLQSLHSQKEIEVKSRQTSCQKLAQLELTLELQEKEHSQALQKLQSKFKKISAELTARNRAYRALQEEIQSQRAAFQDTRQLLVEKNRALQAQLRSYEARIQSENITKLKGDQLRSSQQNAVNLLRQTIAGLQDALKDEKRLHEETQNKLYEKEHEVQALQASNATLKKQWISALSSEQASRKQMMNKKEYGERQKRLKTKTTFLDLKSNQTRDTVRKPMKSSSIFNYEVQNPSRFGQTRRRKLSGQYGNMVQSIIQTYAEGSPTPIEQQKQQSRLIN